MQKLIPPQGIHLFTTDSFQGTISLQLIPSSQSLIHNWFLQCFHLEYGWKRTYWFGILRFIANDSIKIPLTHEKPIVLIVYQAVSCPRLLFFCTCCAHFSSLSVHVQACSSKNICLFKVLLINWRSPSIFSSRSSGIFFLSLSESSRKSLAISFQVRNWEI